MNQTAPQLLVSSETQQDRAKPPSSLSVRKATWEEDGGAGSVCSGGQQS